MNQPLQGAAQRPAQRPFTTGPAAARRGRLRCAAAAQQPMVLLTRERGKNDKMLAELRKHSIAALELPLIQHSDGPDRARLPAVIKQGGYDWVAITSPEAASVFLDAWQEAGQPRVRMAVVGSGTGEVLQQAGLTPDYTSSKANGKTLGSELPKVPGGSNVVLFPASAKAGTDLQEGLSASGFTVNRLSTYNTSGVDSVDAALLQQALQAPIVTFGSPSAVKAWVSLVGLEAASQRVSACIGGTSAKACKEAGLQKIYYPENPGIEGWVSVILQAMQDNKLLAEPRRQS